MRERVFKVEYMSKSNKWRVTSDNRRRGYHQNRCDALRVAHAAAVLSAPSKVIIYEKRGHFLRERLYD